MRAAGLLLLSGCADPPSLTRGAGPSLAGELYACERMEEPTRSWCALSELSTSAGTGHEIYEICRRISEADSRDRCLALAASRDQDPAPGWVCDYAEVPRWRAWCWSSAARRAARTSIHDAAAACAKTGLLRASCASGVLDARVSVWRSGTPVNLTDDLRLLLAEAPRLAYDQELGASAGRTGRALGLLGHGWICDAFPSGAGRLACEVAFMSAEGS